MRFYGFVIFNAVLKGRKQKQQAILSESNKKSKTVAIRKVTGKVSDQKENIPVLANSESDVAISLCSIYGVQLVYKL